MEELSCGAVVPDCTATFRAPSEHELLAQVADHARADHGLAEVPPALVEQVRAKHPDGRVGMAGADAQLAEAWLRPHFQPIVDAWLLAEGIERGAGSDALIRVGVPLAQGYLYGRPAPAMAELDDGLGDRIRHRARWRSRSTPAADGALLVTPRMRLQDVARRVVHREPERRFEPLVCTDEAGRYVGIVRVERLLDALARV